MPAVLSQCAHLTRTMCHSALQSEQCRKRYPAFSPPMRRMLAVGRLAQHGHSVGAAVGTNDDSPSAMQRCVKYTCNPAPMKGAAATSSPNVVAASNLLACAS